MLLLLLFVQLIFHRHINYLEMIHVKHFSTTLFFVLLGFFAFANNAPSTTTLTDLAQTVDHVVIYSSSNYQGKSAKLRMGTTSSEAMKKHGIPIVRSVKLPKSVKMIVKFADKKTETHYISKKEINTRDCTEIIIAKFGARLDKETASTTTTAPKPTTTTSTTSSGNSSNYKTLAKVFYSKDNTGDDAVFIQGKYTHDQIKKKGVKYVRYVEVPAGYTFTAYSLNNFKGTSKTLTESGEIGFLASSFVFEKNDKTASNPPVITKSTTSSNSTIKNYITIYSDFDRKGDLAVLYPGKYDWDQIREKGVLFVKSIKVPEGFEVISYQLNDYKGKTETLRANSNLERRGMSIEVKKIEK